MLGNLDESVFFHPPNIRRVRKYLSIESAEKLIHAFITSRLDYCNTLLYGLPYCALNKLQRVQNAAARVLYLAPRYCIPYHTYIVQITLATCTAHRWLSWWHSAVTREVVSSTPAGPSLRVFNRGESAAFVITSANG